MGRTTSEIRVADEVWIAVALLHREHPEARDFTQKEIFARVQRESVSDVLRPGVRAHINTHCVANRPPDTGRYRMLFETSEGRRRLYRPGDPYHPGRETGKIVPDRAHLPVKYHALVDWYEREWAPPSAQDPLLALAARHRSLWKSVGADAYVRRLREGWE